MQSRKINLFRRRLVWDPILVTPAFQQRADCDIESPVCFSINSNCDLQTFERIEAKLQRLIGRQTVDSSDITIFDEPAQLAFEPIHLIESRYRSLAGITLILVHNDDLESGGHRLMRKTHHPGNRAAIAVDKASFLERFVHKKF